MNSVSYDTYKFVENHCKNEIKQFLNVVFQQVNTEKFYQIFTEVMQIKEIDGMGVYRELLRRAPEAKGGFFWKVKAGLKALKEEKETLVKNIELISDPLYQRKGYLEINLPYRMGASVCKAMGISGKTALVNDKERVSDILQCGYPKPYDVFVPYGDDAPLKKENFPFPISVVGMFAGAHHCQPQNLKSFIQSIYDILEPGGIFYLRDHDANTTENKAIADIAHRFFNALSDVSENDEEAEIRNFQALSYFIQIAQEAGFKVASEPLIREGDASQNALIKFYKPFQDEAQAHIGYIREKMINACRSRSSTKMYFRDSKQTHLTKVEWLNVEQEMAQAAFYKKNFFIKYPHARDAKESLLVFRKSFQAALKNSSFREVLFSDYTLMNSTITIATGVQNIAKSALYIPCKWLSNLGNFLPHHKNAHWEKPSEYYGAWLDKYSNSLEIIPSYEHPFYQNLKGYFKVLSSSFGKSLEQQSLSKLMIDRQTIKNITTTVAISADLLWRQFFASGVKAFYGGQDNADAREIGLIINTNGKENVLKGCEKNVKALVEEEKNPYKGIIVNRYKGLTEVLKELSVNDVEIVEIAGQTALEIEFSIENGSKLLEVAGVQKLYYRHNYFSEENKIVACLVPVNKLQTIFKDFGDNIHRIYDF
ncbi:MAG: hypothetical protein H0X29_03120 [Parachlamydiaceae bacterium]|nr:hypothetical protein [Parachlamydiaceae bacterium]